MLRSVREVQVVPSGPCEIIPKGSLAEKLQIANQTERTCIMGDGSYEVYFIIEVKDDGERLQIRAPYALNRWCLEELRSITVAVVSNRGIEQKFDGRDIFGVVKALVAL
ncbi:hypothetical protein EJ08DRAFT_303936 [Tothia fuscella]|uniref:Uncharacterized protein n=1 Tax=Tothia fuscella TaxID=1048955 RepID=A0A9P4NQ05_9PEZI|nr:hypothetical protein EJ08DRAFT_303936 [Tothia fuscella]